MNRKALLAILGAGAVAGCATVSLINGRRRMLHKREQSLRRGAPAAVILDKELTHSEELVETASEDSFPASDPPAWTGTTGPTGESSFRRLSGPVEPRSP